MPNGCTGFQPFIWWHEGLTRCCNAHDVAYDYSGIPRAVADEAFYYCLQTIDPTIAAFGFGLVSAFGWLFYKRKKK